MKTYTKEELVKIIKLHRKWLFGEKGGKKADLSGSNLSGSNLSGSKWGDEISQPLFIGPIGSRNVYAMFQKHKDVVRVKTGCFDGTLDEFFAKVKERHGDNEHARAYLAAVEFARKYFGVEQIGGAK